MGRGHPGSAQLGVSGSVCPWYPFIQVLKRPHSQKYILIPVSSVGCPAKLVSFRYNRNSDRKKFQNCPKQRICFGSFGIYRNWNVSVLSVVSVHPKKNRKNQRRGEGRRRGEGKWMRNRGKGKVNGNGKERGREGKRREGKGKGKGKGSEMEVKGKGKGR